MASGSLDGTVRLWEAGSGRLLATLQGHTGAVRGVALSSGDGRLVASGSDGRDGPAVGGAGAGSSLATLQGHTGGVWGVALTRGTGGWWPAAAWTGRSGCGRSASAELAGHPAGPQRRGLGVWRSSGDGRLMASGSLTGTVRLWEPGIGPAPGDRAGAHRRGLGRGAFGGWPAAGQRRR